MTRTQNRTQPNLNRIQGEHVLKRERSVKEPRNTISATTEANTQQARNRTQPNTERTQGKSNLSNAIKRAAICQLCQSYKKSAKRQQSGKGAASQSPRLEELSQLSQAYKKAALTIRTENEQRKRRSRRTKGEPRGKPLSNPEANSKRSTVEARKNQTKGGGMATRHESLRIEESTAEAVMKLAEPSESKAAVYNRVLRAGLQALERPSDSTAEEKATEETNAASESELQTLRDYVETLKQQLEIKDEQITSLTTLTSQAQHLHAITEQKALETAEAKQERETGGFWARFFGKD